MFFIFLGTTDCNNNCVLLKSCKTVQKRHGAVLNGISIYHPSKRYSIDFTQISSGTPDELTCGVR